MLREYRPHDLQKRKGLDLAVVFDEKKAYFPAEWHGMRVYGRTLLVKGRKRDSYQFGAENRTKISIIKALAETCLDRSSILADHVHERTRKINNQLWNLIACYGLDAKYGKDFMRLKSAEDFQALLYLGFALVDPLKKG